MHFRIGRLLVGFDWSPKHWAWLDFDSDHEAFYFSVGPLGLTLNRS